jgi:glycerate kinase
LKKFLISPTAFKGTLSPSEAAAVLASVFRKKFPRSSIAICPLADGGDGTLDVLTTVLKAEHKKSHVKGPLGKSVLAAWGITNNLKIFPGKTAIIEMANASGLKFVGKKNKILEASSCDWRWGHSFL